MAGESVKQLKEEINRLNETIKIKNEQIALLRVALDNDIKSKNKVKCAITESLSLMEDIEILKNEVNKLKGNN